MSGQKPRELHDGIALVDNHKWHHITWQIEIIADMHQLRWASQEDQSAHLCTVKRGQEIPSIPKHIIDLY